MRVTIRPVRRDDADMLFGLWQERDIRGIAELVQRAQNLARRQRGLGVVALVEERICGFALATLWPSVAEISDLIVQPTYRRQGIGTRLILYLIEFAQEQRYSIVEIGVKRTNHEALRLYERLGFTLHRSMQYTAANTQHDIHYLRKYITVAAEESDTG